MLPVRSEVGEDRMVAEERLRLWSIVAEEMMCCGYSWYDLSQLLYRDTVLIDWVSDETDDAFAWTRCQSAFKGM